MIRSGFLILLWATVLTAQTPDHRNITQIGSWDASGAKQTKPNRVGSSLPEACSNGETFQLSTTGALYVCVAGALKQVSTPFTISGSNLTFAGTITATSFVGALTALAANGSNCPAGQVPLGVDAGGAAEGCYDPNTYRSGQINFVYGGSGSTNIDATTVNNVWRAHAHYATITEVACWTDAGTVTLAIKDSADNQITTGTLACSSSGASTTSMNSSHSLIGSGEGLGFTTSSVSGVKNLSVSIKYTRSY
jgi:hypothetical protein